MSLEIKKINEGQKDLGAGWGLSCAVNLLECNPIKIRSKEYIAAFAKDICEEIEMKRYGEPIIEHFGEDDRVAGFTMIQLIETSNITAHFANKTNSVYLDVFSCKYFSPESVARFAKSYFNAEHVSFYTLIR